MATHSIILAWKIPWTEEPSGLQCIGLQRVDTTEQLSTGTVHYKEATYTVTQIVDVSFPPDFQICKLDDQETLLCYFLKTLKGHSSLLSVP